MDIFKRLGRLGRLHAAVLLACVFALAGAGGVKADPKPTPLVAADTPVDWWFAFKFNAATYPADSAQPRTCPFGGDPQPYRAFSQHYAVASSQNSQLADGGDGLGATTTDPVGATFSEIYNGAYFYVVWNDQFYDHPKIAGCTTSCGAPWGHSKGVVAWNDDGDGVLIQVTTPSWPGAGSAQHPRLDDGDTLGCVEDNDVQVSQHFFSLALTKDDLVKVLAALANASVVTDPTNPQLVRNGGPDDVQALVSALGVKSASTAVTHDVLSGGVQLISKPSKLGVPPWQLVSAVLGGTPLRAATWWTVPKIPSTTATTEIGCWQSDLGAPGAVDIATSGAWAGNSIGLKGGPGANFNHAKIGVSTGGDHPYTVFGDENQQGALSGKCSSSQNGRGGLFFVVEDTALHDSVAALLTGDSAPQP